MGFSHSSSASSSLTNSFLLFLTIAASHPGSMSVVQHCVTDLVYRRHQKIFKHTGMHYSNPVYQIKKIVLWKSMKKEVRNGWWLLYQQSEPVCSPGKRMRAQTPNHNEVFYHLCIFWSCQRVDCSGSASLSLIFQQRCFAVVYWSIGIYSAKSCTPNSNESWLRYAIL